jgi:hypothetical protein
VRPVHAAIAIGVEFPCSLIIKVGAVHDEHDLIHLRHFGQDLRRLEAGEGLARTRGVPDIAPVNAVFDAINQRLNRVKLIGAQHHQLPVALVHHGIFGDHFGNVAFVEKRVGKFTQLIHCRVVGAAPGECLLETLLAVVGVVSGINPVRDDEQLEILEQPAPRGIAVPVVSVDLIERLFQLQPAPLQFDLDQR